MLNQRSSAATEVRPHLAHTASESVIGWSQRHGSARCGRCSADIRGGQNAVASERILSGCPRQLPRLPDSHWSGSLSARDALGAHTGVLVLHARTGNDQIA